MTEVASHSHAHLKIRPVSSTEPTMTQAMDRHNREQPDRHGLTPSLGWDVRHPSKRNWEPVPPQTPSTVGRGDASDKRCRPYFGTGNRAAVAHGKRDASRRGPS